MAGIDRWLHYTVTTIDRFHCIIVFLCAVKNLLSTYVHTSKGIQISTSYQRYLLSGLDYVHEVYTGTE